MRCETIEAEQTANLMVSCPRTTIDSTEAPSIELLRIMAQIPMDIEGDAFGKIYEYFLGNFAMGEGAPGRRILHTHLYCKADCRDFAAVSRNDSGPSVRFWRYVCPKCCSLSRNHRENSTDLISIYGTERVMGTIQLCKMNLAVHGLEGDIQASEQLLRRSTSAFENKFDFRYGESSLQCE